MIEACSLKVIDGWFWWKKPKQGYENFFQVSNLRWSVFVLGNPTYWGLETAAHPIFASLVLGIFAVCSLVPRANLSHMQQGYLCPKCQNCLLWKVDLGFFLSYRLRITIKITIFSIVKLGNHCALLIIVQYFKLLLLS